MNRPMVERLDEKTVQVTNTDTGVIKNVKLASDKQLSYIRSLETKAEVKHKSYASLTVWGATKVIKRLQKKTAQGTLL